MHIKKVNKTDLDQVKSLWNNCFNDGPEFTDWFFADRYSHENTLAVYNDDGNIEAALQLLPYDIALHDEKTKVSYIVGVSTWPEYRGQGHARELLHASIDETRGRGEYISILLPFNYQFYRKYGWEICYEHLEYRTKLDRFPLKENGILLDSIREIQSEDIAILDNYYNKFMKDYNGYVLRSRDDWQRRLEDISIAGGNAYILQHGDSWGYILLTYKKEKVHMLELVYSDKCVRNTLLYFSSLNRGESSISWTAPADDMTYMDMPDARDAMYRQPFVMGRIVDVPKALITLPLDSTQDIELVMRIHDEFYEFNDKTYLFEYSDENFRITTHSYLDANDQRPYVELDINTLTQLFWGYLRVDDGVRDGKILYRDNRSLEMLDKVFEDSIPMIYEDY